MAEKDPRIKQLERDIEKEGSTVKSKYALVGFGRSTDTVGELSKVEEKGLKLLGALQSVIRLEEAARQGADVGEALASAQSFLDKLKNEQSSRISKLGQDILTSSRKADISGRYKRAFSKFKTRPSGRNFLKLRLPAQGRTKTYKLDEGIKTKQNLVPQRKILGIIRPSNKFGARTLKGLRP